MKLIFQTHSFPVSSSIYIYFGENFFYNIINILFWSRVCWTQAMLCVSKVFGSTLKRYNGSLSGRIICEQCGLIDFRISLTIRTQYTTINALYTRWRHRAAAIGPPVHVTAARAPIGRYISRDTWAERLQAWPVIHLAEESARSFTDFNTAENYRIAR